MNTSLIEEISKNISFNEIILGEKRLIEKVEKEDKKYIHVHEIVDEFEVPEKPWWMIIHLNND